MIEKEKLAGIRRAVEDYIEREKSFQVASLKGVDYKTGLDLLIKDIDATSEFWAAVTPTVVLSLLDEIDALDREADWLADWLPKSCHIYAENGRWIEMQGVARWRSEARKAIAKERRDQLEAEKDDEVREGEDGEGDGDAHI